jgi:DNA polymerase III epsilon subunit-like protein
VTSRSSSVAFVDTETTGLDPERHEIWEVGLILPNGSEHEWQLPVDLSRADAIALNIGRFHERRKTTWADSYTDVDWLGEFSREFVSLTVGLHLAGAVVSFDAERLARLLRANGECPMWSHRLICVEALACGFIAGSRAALAAAVTHTGEPFWAGSATWTAVERSDAEPPWRSTDLSRAVGVEPEDFEKHTALGDARWAKAIYEAVMGT